LSKQGQRLSSRPSLSYRLFPAMTAIPRSRAESRGEVKKKGELKAKG
jgi:hypothetical protein